MILGLALIESLVIYALVIAFKVAKRKKIEILDWFESIKYLEKEKYNFKHRDYLDKFPGYQALTDKICKDLNIDDADLNEDLSKADKNDPRSKKEN